MNKVFCVMRDWKTNSGDSGISNSTFSTFEKAFQYYNKLKELCSIDYDTEERINNNEISITEAINKKLQYASIEAVFKDRNDYYKI